MSRQDCGECRRAAARDADRRRIRRGWQHYVDITADLGRLQALERLAQPCARQRCHRVLSVGLAPGVTNLLAARAYERFDRLDRLDLIVRWAISAGAAGHVRCGAFVEARGLRTGVMSGESLFAVGGGQSQVTGLVRSPGSSPRRLIGRRVLRLGSSDQAARTRRARTARSRESCATGRPDAR